MFSETSTLAALSGQETRIANAVALGMRVGFPVNPLLAIEGELPLVPTSAQSGDDEATVLVLEPRVLARVGGGRIGGSVEPFALFGFGLPIALSSDDQVAASDVVASLHAGVGVRVPQKTGWNLRADARTAMLPGRGVALAGFDFEISIGLYRVFGQPEAPPPARLAPDRDDDGVADEDDACPDRMEDIDGFEDLDGCPDIDDDRDQVLDIADGCRLAPENINGYRDGDGCPDVLPPELVELVPAPRALLFRRSGDALRTRSEAVVDHLADLLERHPSVRIVIVGHVDPGELDDEDADAEHTLSLRRAETVREALIRRGVSVRRLEVWDAAAEFPLSEGSSSHERARNRRVTVRVLRPDLPVASQIAP